MDSATEIINELIDYYCEGVDTYNHNGSTWLIFTKEKKWVIELTKDKTLWYNYNFFTNCFKYLSLDVFENQHYITKWVEQNIIENGIKHTEYGDWEDGDERIDDIIENGVKETELHKGVRPSAVEDTIKNGVKKTDFNIFLDPNAVEHIIQNGVKETKSPGANGDLLSTIEWMEENNTDNISELIDDVIENGVKNTYELHSFRSSTVDAVIESGRII